MTPAQATRYSTVAIIIHWLIAAALVAMVPMGWWMADAIADPARQQTAYQLYQLHKAVGFAILALTIVRLGWRLAHPAPPLPAGMPVWERRAARLTHAAFYALLIALPLTGWIYVSAGWSVAYDRTLNVATTWFGLFQIPHLPGLPEASEGVRRLAAVKSMSAHNLLSWAGIVLAALHAAGALKHHFVDRDDVLARMTPWLRGGETGPGAVDRQAWPAFAGAGLVLLIGASAAVWSRPGEPLAPRSQAPVETPSGALGTEVAPGRADRWLVDRSASQLRFAATQAGAPLSGRFDEWDAHVWFDSADLEGSKVVVLVETGSARTGDATQEGSLAEAEWLDPQGFPTARFEATRFERIGEDRYEAVGELRLKGRATPVRLPFTLTIDGSTARARGEVQLDRTALDVGMVSDPTADWVSRNIAVTFDVAARRPQGAGGA